MKFTFMACLLLFPLLGLAPEKPYDYVAFQPGEYLKYDLHFGAIHAGEATLEIMPQTQNIAGQPQYHIKITGSSFPIFDAFYKVRDIYESFINTKTLLSTVFIRNVQEGKYRKKEYYIFDRHKNQVISHDKKFDVPPNVQDIVSAFYYLRCIDFSRTKIGTFIPMHAFFDDSIFPIGVLYAGKETIATQLGKIRCKVFKPRLIEGRVFKGQSGMTIYVSDDKNQMPIRIQSAVYLGYVRADLEEYKNIKYDFTAKE